MKNDRERMRDVWKSMVGRCHEPTHPSYPWYGAKGISVCERWRSSFSAFLSDVGVIPKGMTLDRLRNSEDYGPSNFRIATVVEQNNNKSDTRLITIDGRTQNMTAWARENGLSPALVCDRIKRGWPTDLAVTKPPLRGGSYLPNPRKSGWTKERYAQKKEIRT